MGLARRAQAARAAGQVDHLSKWDPERTGISREQQAAHISPNGAHGAAADKTAFDAIIHGPASRAHASDTHAAAMAHAVRTGQDSHANRLSRTIAGLHRDGRGRGRLREGADPSAAVVHSSTVFDSDDPATSYTTGSTIDFGENAPVDMASLPDLFDPDAVTGDGI